MPREGYPQPDRPGGHEQMFGRDAWSLGLTIVDMNTNDEKPLEEQIETTDEVAGDMVAEYLPQHLPEGPTEAQPDAASADQPLAAQSFGAKVARAVRSLFRR
jgi:hypothetical protein